MKSRSGADIVAIRAEAVMSTPLVGLHSKDGMRHAASLFLDRRIGGAPVLDDRDEAVGVLSKTDILRYERERFAPALSGEVLRTPRSLGALEVVSMGLGFEPSAPENLVSAWMTPRVFAVSRGSSMADVLREMNRRRVHRVFVKDERLGKLIGVVTTFDLMRFLERVFMPGPHE